MDNNKSTKTSKEFSKKPLKEAPKQKTYYDIKLEASAPVVIQYRILAESPEEAAEEAIKLKGQKQTAPPKISFAKLSKMKLKVYQGGTTTVMFTKNY